MSNLSNRLIFNTLACKRGFVVVACSQKQKIRRATKSTLKINANNTVVQSIACISTNFIINMHHYYYFHFSST